MERKEKRKTDEIDFLGILSKVWKGRRFILKAMLVGLVLGVIIILSLPKRYSSEVKIVSENSKNVKQERANTLASLMGLNIDRMVNTDVSPDLYPIIVESTPYLIELANVKVKPVDKVEMSLYEYVSLHQKIMWWQYITDLPRTIIDLFSKNSVPTLDTIWDIHKLTGYQKSFVNSLEKMVSIKAEKESGVMTVHVEMEDPQVAASVANSVVYKLREYIDAYRKQKVQEELQLMENMFVEAKKAYEATQNRVNEYQKENDGKLLNGQIDADLSFSLYNMMAQQYEMSKMRIVEKLPAFSIIEPAQEPLGPSSPRRTLILVVTILLGVFGGAVWLLIRDAF